MVEDHLDIKMLCRVSNLSISGVYRSFNRLTGKTPGQYINERRLKRASELLRTTDLSVQTISSVCNIKILFIFPAVSNICLEFLHVNGETMPQYHYLRDYRNVNLFHNGIFPVKNIIFSFHPEN